MQFLQRSSLTILIVQLAAAICVGDDEIQRSYSENDVSLWNSIELLLQRRCVKCHGGQRREGGLDLAIENSEALLRDADRLNAVLEAVDTGFMPPEEEPALSERQQKEMVASLKKLLPIALASEQNGPTTPLRRMNRFQYNNAVQDLLELKVEVFPLPERMLREHGEYFQPDTGIMPDVVRAGSRPLGKSQLIERRLAGVTPFPQDLRAEHGFDTQADHLSLSPLLLESLLRLSRSIVESPDFTPKTCGAWPRLFSVPDAVVNQDTDKTRTIVRQRLKDFLRLAFRHPESEEVTQRYTDHVLHQLANGHTFENSMKSAVAAILASPKFFYLHDHSNDQYSLASRLSFFLWGSLPDDELLQLAEQGRLQNPEVLSQQTSRLLKDRKLKRFCDSFPAQWLQLERIVSSTPDRERFPQFYFAKYRASMHMMLEPLLLFEALLIENRSVLQLLDSDFSYRSDLLEAWYRDGSQGNPGAPTVISFRRVPVTDRRQGGVITTAAIMTMTSGNERTKPITRGAWVATVVLNDPPKPPPANVPPLDDHTDHDMANLTLRERFMAHRQNAACAGCHERIDPLGFALENYDAAGIWRDTYKNGRAVDASGILFRRHAFQNVVEFKQALMTERDRFVRAFAAHLLTFALGRKTDVHDSPVIDTIVKQMRQDDYRFHTLIEQIVLSQPFREIAPEPPSVNPRSTR